MEQVTKTTGAKSKKVIETIISDVKGGISLNLTNLIAGVQVMEGTPVTAPSSKRRTVCKQAKILSGSTTTAIKVDATTSHFKVGDVIGAKTGGKAYDITGITTANGISTIVPSTAIDTVTEGDFIYEMASVTATTSALKNTADAILKYAFIAPVASTQAWFQTDAALRADVLEGYVGSLYRATMDVRELKY